MTYTRYFLGAFMLLLMLAAGLNVTVDPAGIYRKGGVNPAEYVTRLIEAENGLYAPEGIFEERLVAKALTRFSRNFDCVVIGSSHVMQISSRRTPKPFPKYCASILNLGVSGGSIEDHMTLSYLATKHGSAKIVLGIDIWTLAFGKDPRWSSYKEDYYQARSEIMGSKEAELRKSTDLSKFKNLFSLEYTIRSIGSSLDRFQHGAARISDIGNLDPAVGGEQPARLNDGSYVYSAKFQRESRSQGIPVSGTAYKTDGALNQKDAILAYRRLLIWLRDQGVEPILLMTPYHENVWKATDSADVRAMRQTEAIVIGLAREMNLKLLGSYNPQTAGCSSDEFYDAMHSTVGCIARIGLRWTGSGAIPAGGREFGGVK